jgi:hypothetical protein
MIFSFFWCGSPLSRSLIVFLLNKLDEVLTGGQVLLFHLLNFSLNSIKTLLHYEYYMHYGYDSI